jgi:putative flippase GtrA
LPTVPDRLGARRIAALHPVRFASVGGTCAVAHLAVLRLVVPLGVDPALANIASFVFFTHVNFVLSQFFTWRDRGTPASRRSWAARLLRFLAVAAATALANQLTFLVVITQFHYLAAACSGLGVGAALNYTLAHHWIFTPVVRDAPKYGANSPALDPRLPPTPTTDAP